MKKHKKSQCAGDSLFTLVCTKDVYWDLPLAALFCWVLLFVLLAREDGALPGGAITRGGGTDGFNIGFPMPGKNKEQHKLTHKTCRLLKAEN